MEASGKSDGLTLAECILHLECGQRSGDYLCRISFDLRRTNPILIETLESVGPKFFSSPLSDSYLISFPFVREKVECFAFSTSLTANQGMMLKLIPKRSLILVDQSLPLARVNAGVVNLGHYQSRGPVLTNPFSLADEEWKIDFTPVFDFTVVYPPGIQDEEYFFTHHVTLAKADGSSFSAKEAHEHLANLCSFLSFCHGYWVSTALTVGIAEDGAVAMEEWGTRLLSPWHRGGNWLDEQHGQCIAELYPLCIERLKDPDWRATIEHAVYWNVRSETSLVGPDGGCILLQTTLERLAWQLLVIDKKSLSEDGFSKLQAADQLRLLLSASSIPLEIPPRLADLQKAAKEFNWTDGPQAFVSIRNRLVHPPKAKGKQGKKLPVYEAYALGKWYLDLLILSACKYQGLYANRTKISRWVGEVERVPWAS